MLSVFATSFARQNTIDSLKSDLLNYVDDSTRVNRLNDLCWEYSNLSVYDTALIIGNQALQVAENINFEKGIADAYNNIGNIWRYKGNYVVGLEYFIKCIKIREAINDKKGLANTFNNMGIIYAMQKDYSTALKYFQSGLAIREEIKDQHGLADSYVSIGIIYSNQKDYDLALINHKSALDIYKKMHEQYGIASCYYNIGNINYGNVIDKGS